MKNLRIVFMGTPEFAVATLGSLLINGYDVAAVVTVPDKPSGRGRKLTKSAVKEFAEFSSLPVYQPSDLKDPEFINALQNINADLFVVVAFRMLPAEIWKMPPSGTINLHASLLPDYRGAAPINRVIMNGETKTGITTFLIDEKTDTGSILMREEVPIFPFENAGDLHDRLMKQGALLVIRTIKALAENNIHPIPQSQLISGNESLKKAPKIFPEDCFINWCDNLTTIHNIVRGLSPYPCARSWFTGNENNVSFKIFESKPETAVHSQKKGTVISDGINYLKIACEGGFLNIINLQLEGKKPMNVKEFLRGFKISNYSTVTTVKV